MEVKLLSIILVVIQTVYSENVTSQQRAPRVSGRIVKLYTRGRSNGFQCKSEGFYQDDVDCSTFYRCVEGGSGKFITFRFQCGPGTVYDPNTNVCNHPASTLRRECGGLQKSLPSTEHAKNENFHGHEQSAPKPFSTIKADNYDTTRRPSYSENNNYNEENEIDQSPSYNNHQQQTTTEAATTSAKQTTKQTYQPSTTDNQPSGDDKCSSDGFMGDSKDCRTFYRCVANGRGGFIRYEFSCSESTVWDQEIQACNHPWAAQSQRCSRGELSNEIDYKPTKLNVAKDNSRRSNQSQNQVNYGSQSSQSQNQVNYGSNVNQKQNQTNYGDRVNQTQNQINYGDSVSQSQSQANYGSQSTQSQTQINHSTQTSQAQTQTIYHPATNENNAHQQDEYKETTTKRNNKGNQCSSSGFMGDNDDCKKFYRCVDNGRGSYTKFEFSCGEGTVWDPNIEACNHAWAVKECGGSKPEDVNKIDTETSSQSKPTPAQTTAESIDYDQGYAQQQEQTTHTTTTTKTPKQTQAPSSNYECQKDGFIGDSQDCKKFYRCVDNGRGGFIKYEFSCGQGTVWDQEIQGCNHESQSKCGSHYTTENPQTSSSAPLQDEMPTEHTHKVQQPTEQQQQSSTPRETQPSSSKQCSAEGFVGDDDDCRKFYRCVDNGKGGYTKYEFTCGEGTQWEQEIEGCNHATKDCRRSQTQGQTSSTRPSDTTTQREWEKETTSKESTTQVQSKPTSSDQCTSEGFFGDASDCKRFYRCVENGLGGFNKYEFTCGEGTVWDQEIQGCNHESDVSNCGASSSQTTRAPEPQRTTTKKQGSQTTNRVDDEYPSQEETTRRPASSSSGTCDSEGFFGDEKDCKKFYRCVDNGKGGYTKYDFVCGEGTAWDQKIQGCNHENQVDCKNQNNQQSQSNEPQQSTTKTPPPSHDEPQKETTTEKKPCDDDQQNESHSSSSGKCESEGYYGNPEDCKKFYRCVDNGKGSFTKYDFTCGEGTIWDQDLTTCNHPQDVSNPSCKNSESSTESTTKKQESTGQNKPCSQSTTTQGSTCGSQSSTESSTSESESTTKRHKDNVTCPHAGFYANPNDCKKFYRCVDWDGNGKKYSVFHFDCGEGTIWDPELETCNYEESVYPPRDCSGSQQQAGTTESSDTTTQTESTTSEPSSTTTAKSTTSTTKKSTTTKSSTTTTTTQKQTTSEENTTEKSTTEQTTQQTTSEKTTEKQTEGTTEGTTEKQSESTTQGSTTQGSTTSEQTTEGTTEHTTEQTEESTTESSSSSNKTCPETEDDQYLYVCPTGFRRHPKYCNLFYQCTENDDNHDVKVAVFHCPNNTIYDESKTQCLEESETDQKCDGEIAESRRFRRLDDNSNPPLTVHRQRLLCPSEGHFAFDKNDQCSPAFLKCRRSDSSLRMRGYIYQCPENYVYWAVSRRCERASRMKGCSGADKTWIRRWEIPVEMLNIAV